MKKGNYTALTLKNKPVIKVLVPGNSEPFILNAEKIVQVHTEEALRSVNHLERQETYNGNFKAE